MRLLFHRAWGLRRSFMLSSFMVALALCSTSAPSAARRSLGDYMDKPTKRWREGPVRYIITKWEDKEYKSLKTREDRARFIENFWRRRDETPDTPGNEFRATFWKRVRAANRLYSDTTSKPGWLTDMGKIHILLGPPDDMSRDLVAQGRRGTVIWTYRNTGERGVGPNAVIAFAQDVTGEFRLSTEPSKDADPRQGIPLASQPAMGTDKYAKAQILLAQRRVAQLYNLSDPLIRQAGGPLTATPLELATQLLKLQQPSRKWEIRETVTTQQFFGAVPLNARADFFKTTGSKTLVVLTVGIRSSAVHFKRVGGHEEPDVLVYARILDLTGNDPIASLEQDGDFIAAPENRDADLDQFLLFQARVLLDPGSYKARLTALDRAGGRAGSYEMSLTVPDMTVDGLNISSLMLARSIRPLNPTGNDNGPSTYVMGNLRILPRLSPTLTKDDSLAFYYQIYGASNSPESDRPLLDVDYGFYTLASNETLDLGHVTFDAQTTAVHGYEVPLKDWPAGHYMLRVSVTDDVTKSTAKRDLVFEVQ